MSCKKTFLVVSTIFLLTSAVYAHAAASAADMFPEQPDPFMGDYVGRWDPSEEVNPELAAQIIPLGRDNYRIRLVNKLDMRCPPLVQVEVSPNRGKLEFKEGSLHGSTDGTTFTGGRGTRTFSMIRVDRQSPNAGLAPPEGAIVLFDGSNLDAWTGTDGWLLQDGVLMVTPDGKYLESKGKWRDIQLHVEFRLPYMPLARGQGRGNSGVFVQDAYEVQVLDSFGLEGYYDECGALYKLSAPHVNACFPPLAWQTYDITYRAPRHDAAGTLLENGRMTVYHNGVLIHHEQELKWRTEWKEEGRLKPPPREPGAVKLQGHDNFVQFRNIWLVDLDGAPK
jgi:hypothetical protein